MKNCEQFLPELNAWIDGELEDSRALEAHLAECASCLIEIIDSARFDGQVFLDKVVVFLQRRNKLVEGR